MHARLRHRISLAALAAALVASVVAATAFAVTVYSNDFSSRAEYEQIRPSGGGKACDRRYRAKQETMLVSIKKGPASCGFRAPVTGDSELPDHQLTVDAKVLKKQTQKSARGGAFVELSVRAGGGGVGYTLTVFPHKGRYELTRGPRGGGDAFPAEGKSKAIKGINKRNKLTLVADGARITALANKKQLASVQDRDPGQVTGRKVRFAIGNAKKTGKDVAATVKSVAVGVPK